jgi:hypothetical protein
VVANNITNLAIFYDILSFLFWAMVLGFSPPASVRVQVMSEFLRSLRIGRPLWPARAAFALASV